MVSENLGLVFVSELHFDFRQTFVKFVKFVSVFAQLCYGIDVAAKVAKVI